MANLSLFDVANDRPQDVDYNRPSSTMESVGASFALAWRNNSFSKIKDFVAREYELVDDTSDVLQPDELNKKYPEMGVPFAEPMSARKAEILAKKAREDRQLQQVIDGNRGGFWGEAAEVAAGFGANVIDPVGLAAGFGVEAGLTKALARTSIGAKLGYTSLAEAQTVKASMKTAASQGLEKEVAKHALELKYLEKSAQNIGRSMGEGVAGNLLDEALIQAPLSTEEMQDYDALTSLTFAVGAGMVFPVVTGAMAKGFEYLKRRPQLNEKAMLLAEQQANQGKTIDINPVIDEAKLDHLEEYKAELEELNAQQFLSPEDEIRAKDLMEEIKEIESIQRPSDAEIIRQANSVESNYDYDPSLDRSNELDPNETQFDSSLDMDTTDFDTRVEETARGYGIEDTAEIKQFVAAEKENVSKMREAADTLIKCFTGMGA